MSTTLQLPQQAMVPVTDPAPVHANGISCDKPGHFHYWPTQGHLMIERCEHFCLFCTGHKAQKHWSSAWFLRRHVRSAHCVHEFPNLDVSIGWEKRPSGNARPLNKKRPLPGANRKRSKVVQQALSKFSSPLPTQGPAPVDARPFDFNTAPVNQSNHAATTTTAGVVDDTTPVNNLPSAYMGPDFNSSYELAIHDTPLDTPIDTPVDTLTPEQIEALPVEDRLLIALAPQQYTATHSASPQEIVNFTPEPTYSAPVAQMVPPVSSQDTIMPQDIFNFTPQPSFAAPVAPMVPSVSSQVTTMHQETLPAFVAPEDTLLSTNDTILDLEPLNNFTFESNDNFTLASNDIFNLEANDTFNLEPHNNFDLELNFSDYLNEDVMNMLDDSDMAF